MCKMLLSINLLAPGSWFRLGSLGVALAALGGCAAVDDVPQPERQAPQLILQRPAIVDNDTLGIGRGGFQFEGQSYVSYGANNSVPPPTITVYSTDDGMKRTVGQVFYNAQGGKFAFPYTLLLRVQLAKLEVEVLDSYDQISSRSFWAKPVNYATPNVTFINLPANAPTGKDLPIRARFYSLDLPTELRLYQYYFDRDNVAQYRLLSALDASTVRAGAVTGYPGFYDVTLPAYPMPPTAAGTPVYFLLHGRTAHGMQPEQFGTVLVR